MHLCFVATLPGVLPLLTDAPTTESGGGVQVQIALLGRALAERGHDVTFVVATSDADPALLPDSRNARLHIIRAYSSSKCSCRLLRAGCRGVQLWRTLRAVNADIYLLQGVGAIAGLLRAFCHCYHRKFVFWSASATDPLCSVPGKSRVKRGGRWAARFGMRGADLIIAQTDEQVASFHQYIRRDAKGIPNFWPTAAAGEPRPDAPKGQPALSLDAVRPVLWVSNIREEKRPHLALDVAQMLPDIPFVFIGGPVKGREDFYVEIERRAHGLSNVQFCGLVPFAETGAYFARASLLLNTSAVEGFPNTYLQAWSSGVPVVATFDPDEVICQHDLGRHCEDAAGLAAAVRALWEADQVRAEIGLRAQAYLRQHHSLEAIVPQFERLLQAL